MKDKVDKLYAIFSSGILLSEECHIEAITGYDVMESVQDHVVFSLTDLEKRIRARFTKVSCISNDQLWKYTCPIDGEEFYVGRNIFARSVGRDNDIYIHALYDNYKHSVITTKLANITTYPFIFDNGVDTIRIVRNIGVLSRPHAPHFNASCPMRTIQLPLTSTQTF